MMKKTTKFLKTLAAAAILSAAFSATTFAANGLEMSTKYTGISVKPGDTLSFSLDFTNTTGTGLNTELSATGLPDGWTGYFEGSGKQITSTYVKQNAATVNTSNDPDDGLATYNITVPDTATKGSYNLTLEATDTADASISSNLAVTVNVTDESTGTSQLQTTYAEQEGPTGTTFTFNSTIQNNSSADQTYSLAADVPTGWTATFKPSGQSTQVSSVDVAAKGSQGMTITVTPPDKVTAGEYEIPITATSSDETLKTTLKVTITGTYKLDVQTADGTLSFNANVNKQKAVTMNVVNAGNIDLQNVTLTTSAPSGWTVDFSEASIPTLAAGETHQVTMYVTPSKEAMAGDYAMTVSAATDDTSIDQSFRVTVKTSTLWGVVGVCLIVIVVMAISEVFHKYGRH